MFEKTYTEMSGQLVRVCTLEQATIALQRDSLTRPAARYNRQGENALYLTVSETSARVAMRKYANEVDSQLYLVKYSIDPCLLVDLRHSDNGRYRQLASQDWRAAIVDGEEPASWQVSDLLRLKQEIGLIDPSRKDPDVWHVTLFRWNEAGAPSINLIGQPCPIEL